MEFLHFYKICFLQFFSMGKKRFYYYSFFQQEYLSPLTSSVPVKAAHCQSSNGFPLRPLPPLRLHLRNFPTVKSAAQRHRVSQRSHFQGVSSMVSVVHPLMQKCICFLCVCGWVGVGVNVHVCARRAPTLPAVDFVQKPQWKSWVTRWCGTVSSNAGG